jgi:hypothetical protein
LNEYCLYEKENGTLILTLIKPSEWNSLDKTFIATVRKLGDSTWEKVEESDSSVGRDNPSSITIDGTYTL